MSSPGVRSVLLGIVLLLLAGCSSTTTRRVHVPARVDLMPYQTIGMLRFDSNSEGNLDQFTSQRFLQTIQDAQPGLRVLELGDRDQVLAAVGHSELNFQAIRAIGEEFGVDAVIVGEMDVTDVKPKMDLGSMLTSLSVTAEVEASLTARIHEARSGATLWTDSARGKETVGHVSLTGDGPVSFGASDPDEAYGDLVDHLIYYVTDDFRGRWETRRFAK